MKQASADIKQCICPDCGAIAEVRRQKTGKRMRYMVCKNGHGGLTSRSKADHWEAIEQKNIGVFGEMPANQAETPPEEPAPEMQNDLQDFEPQSQELPENAEPEEPAQNDKKAPESLPTFAKVGLVLLAAAGFGGAAYLSNKKRGLK